MTVRGFLLWYLGAVTLVGVAGASGYQIMARQRAESAVRGDAAAAVPAPVATVAYAQPQAAAPRVPPAPVLALASTSTRTAALPPLRRHVAAVSPPGPLTRHPLHRAIAMRHPVHRPVVAAVVWREAPRYRPGPYAVLYPPPPRVAYYRYPGYYVYQGGYAYFSYYPRYGYYPAF